MSTSSADKESPPSSPAAVDERPRPTARPSGRSRDDITVVQVPAFTPVPGFLSAERHRSEGEAAGRAPADATPTLEAEVKRLQTALNTAARNRPAQRSARGGRLLPARTGPGSAGPGMLTALLSRPGVAVAGMALASMMIAVVAGTFVFVILPQADDWDLAEQPPVASLEPSLPEAPAPPRESAAIVNSGEAALQARPAPPQSALPPLPAAQPETRPAEKPMEVAALDLPPDMPARREEPVTTAQEPAPPVPPGPPAQAAPEPEKSERAVVMVIGVQPAVSPEPAPLSARELTSAPLVPPPLAAPVQAPPPLAPPPSASAALVPPALPEPPALATPSPPPSASQEPPPESIAAKRMQPLAGRLPGPSRTSFQFADSDVRHLTGVELQRLPADRLRIARNEIFARKGRYFKDDALRSYFSQFAWYQPRAWDVPLNAVEVANVGRIQSIEDAADAPTRSVGDPVAAEPDAGYRSALPDPHRRYLTPADVQGLSTDQLVLVRNEIFARKGRYFKDPALRSYFEQFPWYQPYAWDVPLSPVERANIDMIQSVEQSRGGRLPPT
jgi:YARHG domain